MDYFKILNLQREPFSNSPEPDFFFQSDQHLACLQKLELAIRLRRGLNVVLGDVGAGKTTLCRQIILKFSELEEDRKKVETHLIMDPSFTNAQQFLTTVALLLGLETSTDERSEWQLKEEIKKYLFKQGIDEGKIVVLIIDEGQKLPSFCLEILREFLNYETNEYKLLQIVIFAQREFEQTVRLQANFADRVNQYIYILPLNFQNTRNMIMFRMATASSGSAAVPAFFTLPALWAVHRKTGGHPRKIITLCHQAILAMIIQNRVKAGFFLVRSCAARVNLAEKAKWPRWALALAGGGLILWLLISFYGGNDLSGVSDRKAAMKAWLPVGTLFTQGPFAKKAAKMIRAFEKKPKALGRLVMKTDEQVLTILERIYGRDGASQLASFAKANPHLSNHGEVKKGAVVNIPTRSNVAQPLPPGKYWIQIHSLRDIEDAYAFMSIGSNRERFFLLPLWNRREGLTFAVLLQDGFDDEAMAQSFRKALPLSYRITANVVSRWNDDELL